MAHLRPVNWPTEMLPDSIHLIDWVLPLANKILPKGTLPETADFHSVPHPLAPDYTRPDAWAARPFSGRNQPSELIPPSVGKLINTVCTVRDATA